jgi:tRNA pseudouridine38-40 synthase
LKRNFKLILEYDGSCYHGWQRQNGVLTIQEVLESRLEIILSEPIRTRASGRTDAGVHARGQVVGFYTRSTLKPEEIQRGLNSLLPPDIAVLQAEEMEPEFHARFSAASKVYEYRILNRPAPSALERRFAWHIRRPLQQAPMAECLESILGLNDFSAFMAAGSSVTSTERHVYRATIEAPDPHHLICTFEANGFLRHMVRNLVGTLVEVGKGKLAPGDFQGILAGRDRRQAGMTAPAHGLYLAFVRYEGSAGLPLKGRN